MKPKIVVLCGSTRFEKAYKDAMREETLAGKIVLSVGLLGHVEGIDMNGQWVEFNSTDAVHMTLKGLAGLYDAMIVLPDGTKALLIRSIAFDKMTADEWAQAWPRLIDVVHQKILPGIGREVVENEIARLLLTTQFTMSAVCAATLMPYSDAASPTPTSVLPVTVMELERSARGLRDALAERLEQHLDPRLLVRLRVVVHGPVLHVALALRRKLDHAVVAHGALPREPEQYRFLMFTDQSTKFVVGAGTRLLDEVHDVGRHVGVRRLRRDDEAHPEFADAAPLGDLASALLTRGRERLELGGDGCGCCHSLKIAIPSLIFKPLDSLFVMAILSP